jgi:hypothetical protein
MSPGNAIGNCPTLASLIYLHPRILRMLPLLRGEHITISSRQKLLWGLKLINETDPSTSSPEVAVPYDLNPNSPHCRGKNQLTLQTHFTIVDHIHLGLDSPHHLLANEKMRSTDKEKWWQQLKAGLSSMFSNQYTGVVTAAKPNQMDEKEMNDHYTLYTPITCGEEMELYQSYNKN